MAAITGLLRVMRVWSHRTISLVDRHHAIPALGANGTQIGTRAEASSFAMENGHRGGVVGLEGPKGV